MTCPLTSQGAEEINLFSLFVSADTGWELNRAEAESRRPHRCRYNRLRNTTKRALLTHGIRVICIHNTAQRDEHYHPPSREAELSGGEKKSAEY